MSKRRNRTTDSDRAKKSKTMDSTLMSSCPLREGEDANVGDTFWVKCKDTIHTPARITKITKITKHRVTFKVDLRWFRKRAYPDSTLGHSEWVLTNETTTESSDTLANKANILPWQEFNKSNKRNELMYYRLVSNEKSPGDVDEPSSYRLSTSDDYDKASSKLDDWMKCACGCGEYLNPDDGYTYCDKCSRSTQDDHIIKAPERATSALQEKRGKVYVLKSSGKEEEAKCECGSPFESFSTGDESPSNEVLAARPVLQIAIDVGTTYLRVIMRKEGKDFEFHETFDSAIMLPDGKLQFELMAGVRGNIICPLKALIRPDSRTLGVLREAQQTTDDDKLRCYGRQVFGMAIKNAIDKYLDGLLHYLDCSSRNDLYEHYDITIGVAYPCSFNSLERGAMLTAIYSAACPVSTSSCVRMIALPEPVAAFFAMKEGLEFGLYLILDVGGSTTDASIVEKKSPETIKVINEFGVNLGVDTPDRLTAEWLAKEHQKIQADALTAVRTFSQYAKGDDTSTNHKVCDVDIKDEYSKQCQNFWDNVKPFFRKVAESPDVENVNEYLSCGGGSQSKECQQLLREAFPGKTMKVYGKPNRYSHVLTGLGKRLELPEQTLYSPITLCVEHDEPDADGVELLVIAHKQQALQHAKLPSSQLGEKLTVFDVSFGDSKACLTFKGTFQEVAFQTNKSGLRIVKRGASLESFYLVGKIEIPSDRWDGKKTEHGSRGLNIVQISEHIGDGVLCCKGLLTSAPPHQTQIEGIEKMQLHEVKKIVEDTNGWVVYDEYTLVTPLNLNESNRRTTATI